MSSQEDEELMALLASAKEVENNKALRVIYKNNFELIMTLVLKNNGDRELAADIFQDAVIILFNKVRKGDFILTSALSTYLYGVSRNLLMNHRSKTKRLVTLEDTIKYIKDDQSLEFDNLIETEKSNLIADLIGQLGDGCKQILTLFYFEKNSMKEIQQIMKVSSIAVTKNKKMNCMKKLRKLVLNSSFYKSTFQ